MTFPRLEEYSMASACAQSCMTLSDDTSCNLPGSSVWNFPGTNIGVGSHFPQAVYCPLVYLTYIELLLFSHSVVSDSLWPHGLQHTRLLCPSQLSGACSNSCPLSQWCDPTISSFVFPFSSCIRSFPASGSFPRSQILASSGQGIGVQHQFFQWIFIDFHWWP